MGLIIKNLLLSNLQELNVIEERVWNLNRAKLSRLEYRIKNIPKYSIGAFIDNKVVGYLFAVSFETSLQNINPSITATEVSNIIKEHEKGKFLLIISVTVSEEFRRQQIASKLIKYLLNILSEKIQVIFVFSNKIFTKLLVTKFSFSIQCSLYKYQDDNDDWSLLINNIKVNVKDI